MSEEGTRGETLHLLVSVGDVTIEVDGPIDDAETWFEALQEDYLPDVDPEDLSTMIGGNTSQETSTSEGVASEQSGKATPGKSRSLPEYYKMADGPSKRDAALIVGWYLEYHEEQSDFIKPEVEGRAQDAKISLGANVSRDLSKQVEGGHIQKVDERDGNSAFSLTITGEEYVQEELLEL